jgi:hypothetical protein
VRRESPGAEMNHVNHIDDLDLAASWAVSSPAEDPTSCAGAERHAVVETIRPRRE